MVIKVVGGVGPTIRESGPSLPDQPRSVSADGIVGTGADQYRTDGRRSLLRLPCIGGQPRRRTQLGTDRLSPLECHIYDTPTPSFPLETLTSIPRGYSSIGKTYIKYQSTIPVGDRERTVWLCSDEVDGIDGRARQAPDYGHSPPIFDVDTVLGLCVPHETEGWGGRYVRTGTLVPTAGTALSLGRPCLTQA